MRVCAYDKVNTEYRINVLLFINNKKSESRI